MDIINKYFPNLTDRQKEQIAQLDALYREWNAKINVISRKDIDNLYEHHVLHSMAIAKAINFKDRTEILDFGCGGGFPGIPLPSSSLSADSNSSTVRARRLEYATRWLRPSD